MAARRTDRTAGARAGRETRATSRIAEGGAEEVAQKPGAGLAEGMGIVTFLMLIAAFLLVDYILGKQYGTGLFFK